MYWLPGAGKAHAAPCDPWTAKLVSVQGSVEIRAAASTGWTPAKLGTVLCSGDMVRVNEFSRAALLLGNESFVRLDQRTTITLTGARPNKPFLIRLIEGVAFFFSRFPRKLDAITPFVNATIEGTEFSLTAAVDHSLVTVIEGRILASNAAGSIGLAAGEAAIARIGAAPVPHPVIRPRDAVLWALYYPPVIYWQPAEFARGLPGSWQYWTRQSIESYWQGDLAKAYESLGNVRKRVEDPRFFLYRAALGLTVGRIQNAENDIRQVLSLDPGNGEALALQALIALVHNQKEKARGLVEKALAAAPAKPTVHVAQSYVRQAHFDIEGALQSLEEASNLGPENALVWARLAELYLAAALLDKSTAAAEKAVTLNPTLARTQTVFGFSALVRIDLAAAREAFDEAIRLDSADPIARLGLGLALIRTGELNAGRAEVEIAAGLDPNNALIRSYLGKAYFDEREESAAQKQYTIAKELDPNDPTAFYYNAILKQTTNRPVEALADLEKSIALNDNRAVYRSSLLLDQDLAARSAGLGRIFNDLGFQQRGRLEGWKSVNTDPTDYSGHRFLADTYASLPRFETARVSELLQSQLLQPLNVTPVQPLLAESNVLILEGSGPAGLSFNEFNPLFLRNRLALLASGVVGEKDTFGNELVQSGVWNKLSYSLGQFHYQTDGFRDNNDLDQDLYNGFVQMALTPHTSIQAEYRYRDIDSGDLDLLFNRETFLPDERNDETTRTARAGISHTFSPNSRLIGSFIYRDKDFDRTDSNILLDSKTKEDTDGLLSEAQYLYRSNRFDIVSGLGYYDGDIDERFKFDFFPPLDFLDTTIKENLDVDHFNAYTYSNIFLLDQVMLTLGLSYDSFDNQLQNSKRLNPKFGLTWKPVPATTLRFSAYRYFTRTLASDQTIEPTQVAGFNQLYSDKSGTEVKFYGAALDQSILEGLYLGLEAYRRDLDVPFFTSVGTGPLTKSETEWREVVMRGYLYWAPHAWVTATVDYQFEDFYDRDEFQGDDDFNELETHRLKFGGNFFHPSGFIAKGQATYVDQDGRFFVSPTNPDVGDGDSFWVVDAALGYRLPKRFGIVSLEFKNLFDNQFDFQDTDPANPRIVPGHLVLLRCTLSF
ncbi:MAG: tetratricopeptide repeat protein [Desulfobacterales bacterium]|nr:tetratricopeptide repeat protein [Desulfobacterales bacterium]